jgi:farnesyl-diphosphate farnesyltransferase
MRDIEQMLQQTSRTFALAIPLLPEPTRTDVTLAYLVLRIADTLEDSQQLLERQRVQALSEFDRLLESLDEDEAWTFAQKWSAKQPLIDVAFSDTMLNTPLVIQQLSRRNESTRKVSVRFARYTARGMASFIRDGKMQLANLDELRQYCYVVAGVVGEMLTELFALQIPSFGVSDAIRDDARAFGEGLQLVNILKDSEEDALRGRVFLPDAIQRSDVFQLARQDLRAAERYVNCLEQCKAPPGFIAFTLLPLRLAWATLDVVEKEGPGAKVSRPQVMEIVKTVQTNASSSS